MALSDDLLTVLRAYCEARKIALPTLSTRILNDGRALSKLASGTGTLTMRNYDRCMDWLSVNWPEGVQWPEGVSRPTPTVSLPPNPDRVPGERAGLSPQQAEEAA